MPITMIDLLMADDVPGGGEEHVNLQGVEVVDVGCGLGRDPALPPPDGILPAGGNGQGGVAGNADAPAPVAPALMTLLQQVLATQQAIVGRLACVENNQVQQVLATQRAIVGRLACVENSQVQPQQQLQQQQVVAQPPGGAPLGGLMSP